MESESLRALPFERTHATEAVAAWAPCLSGQPRRTAAAKDVVRPHALKCVPIFSLAAPTSFFFFLAFPLLRHSDLMQMGILSLAEDEPEYKKWLARWYLRLGYEHRETLTLRFEPDEVSEMYSYLKQRVPCKYVLFDKRL